MTNLTIRRQRRASGLVHSWDLGSLELVLLHTHLMVMCRSIFAIMAVTLRMSSAVRLYIVHSAKEKRGSSQYIHLFTVFTVRMFHQRNKQSSHALFKSVIWRCLKTTSILFRLAQTVQLSVRTGFFPCRTPRNTIESWQNSKHTPVKLSRKGSRCSLPPLAPSSKHKSVYNDLNSIFGTA